MYRRHWVRSIPLGVALCGVALTGWAWWQAERGRQDVAFLGFQREAARVEAAVRERVELYETVLRAARTLVGASEEVTPEEWFTLADVLEIRAKYPGISGLVYFTYVPPGGLEAFLDRQGQVWGPAFTFRLPPGSEAYPDHYVASLVAPQDKIVGALLGFDMGAEAVRRATMEKARDSGRAVLSPVTDMRVLTVGAIEVSPVYAHGTTLATVAERRTALRGLVAVGYDVTRILAHAVGSAAEDLRVEVYDRPEQAAEDSENRGRRIYMRGPEVERVVFQQEASIVIGQRAWSLDIKAGPVLVNRLAPEDAQPLFLGGGVVASLLLGLTVWLLTTRREQAQDLADRMTAALQESEERYRQLFVGNRAVELLVDPDTGQIVDANAAAARFYGWSIDDLRRMTLADIHALGTAQAQEEMALAVAERRDHFQVRHRLANGDLRDVEVHSGPVPLGTRRLLYSIIHDVTERRQAEVALSVSEARFRALFEDSPLAIQVVDPDGRTTRVNRAWSRLWVHVSEGGVLADPQLVDAGVTDQLRRAYGGQTVEIPPFRYWPPGTATGAAGRWLRAYAYPIRDPDGRGHQIIIVWEDVTEKLAQEERLRETLRDLERSNAELEQFAYVASHDLQEPLRMISSYIGLLRRRYGEAMSHEALEFMSYTIDGAHRMQDIINDLLTYSRVGRKGRPFEPTDLGAVALLARETLAITIEEAGAQVIIAEDLPLVQGDARELARLFQNLIGNAVKYGRPDEPPRVHISCEAGLGLWRIVVRDNGIGIDPEFHQRIFQIFQRLHTRDRYGGTGVGLAICKKIVDRHGGRIGVSCNDDVGVTFWFTLPVMAGSSASFETPPETQDGDADGHPNVPLREVSTGPADEEG